MKERIINACYFEDFEFLIDDVIDRIEYSEEYLSISIIGKYEEISQLLNAVISNHDISIGDIELCSKNCNGYTDEYLLTIYEDEDIGIVVSCEPLKKNGHYLNYGADIVYILENCSSAVQHHCETDDIRCAVIGETPENCCVDCSCNCMDEASLTDVDIDLTEDGHSFSIHKQNGDSYCDISFYSSELLGKDMIKAILDEFWD